MIELIATVESLAQARAVLPYVDTIYFGEERFGLRLPTSFSREEQVELVKLAHEAGKLAHVAVNGIMHPDKMTEIPAYLEFLKAIGVDAVVIGDPGVVYRMRKQEACRLPYIYDAQTMVTSARQINFWHKRGAIGAVLAREVPFAEMEKMVPQLHVPAEVLVYGATCIHQSKRPLLQNYYNFTEQEEKVTRKSDLFLSEPKKDETHYSIFEDSHGTHIFANNDVCLISELKTLTDIGMRTWKLDGIYTRGDAFIDITKIFAQAKEAILTNNWQSISVANWEHAIHQLHPQNRGIDKGFYELDPNKIK